MKAGLRRGFAFGLASLVFLLLPPRVAGAEGPVKASFAGRKLVLSSDGRAVARIQLAIEAPYHIYSTVAQLSPQGMGPSPTGVALSGNAGLKLDGPVTTSSARKAYDPNFDLELLTLEGLAWLDVTLKAQPALRPGTHAVTLVISYQACTEESCLPPAEVEVRLNVDWPDSAISVRSGADDPRWLEAEALAEKRRGVLKALAEPVEFAFTALDGRQVDTRSWRGKVAIVDFWASWCMPCIESVPRLKELYARYHPRGLEVIHISVDGPTARPALEKLITRLQIPWPQYFDGRAHQTPLAVRYGVQPIPHVLLVGPDGLVVAVNPTSEKMEAEIKRLLKL